MKKPHILLVEDNDIDAYVTKLILQRLGLADCFVHKHDGRKAIHFLTEKDIVFPDIILLDIRMPELDGFGFLDEFVKLEAQNKNCRVFMLSSSNDESDVAKAKSYYHVVDYFFKPFNDEHAKLLLSLVSQ
jgi:CheY-like chemotaxis protein